MNKKTTRLRLQLWGTCAAALVSLSGCAWLNPPVEPMPSASASRTAVPVPTTDSSGLGVLPAGIVFDRSKVADAAVTHLDCAAGSVTVEDNSGSYAIDGDCDSVTVKGDSNIVTAGRVARIRVEGYSHVVLLGSAGSVTLPSETIGCVVQWESGDPVIHNDSVDSFLTKAKA